MRLKKLNSAIQQVWFTQLCKIIQPGLEIGRDFFRRFTAFQSLVHGGCSHHLVKISGVLFQFVAVNPFHDRQNGQRRGNRLVSLPVGDVQLATAALLAGEF